MPRNYQVDDFLQSKQDPMDIVIDKKVSLLYDLCVLVSTRHDKHDDPREEAVKAWLKEYATERQLDNAVHDVVIGKTKINTVLSTKGLM